MNITQFMAVVPNSESATENTFTYILESPGIPKTFTSWSSYLKEVSKRNISEKLLPGVKFYVYDESHHSVEVPLETVMALD